jgi:nitrogen fixation/metabolism regulation signal transduction histidine kinase
MRIVSVILLLSLLASTVAAQERPSPLDDLFKSAEQWARENLDDQVFDVLKRTDQEAVRALFNEMDRRLQNENVTTLDR